MSGANVKITKSIAPPVAEGTHYRLVCMTGKNKGLSYYLNSNRAVMGRSETVDVQVLDTKSSREHAELVKMGSHYVLTDLGSQNGVVVNDLKVTQHQLSDGDLIIIGQTVFKYNVVEVERNLELVEDQDDEEDEDEVALIEDKKTKKKKGKSKKKDIEDQAAKKKKMVLGVVAILAAVFLLDGGETKKKDDKNANQEQELEGDQEFLQSMSKSQVVEDKETREKLEAIIHRGRREYREGNYFRAIDEFDLALILVPNHAHASYLLDRAKQRLDEEIKMNKDKAERDANSLQYDSARISLCSIMRILTEDKEDPRYKEAETSLAELEIKMGLEKGEIKCQ